MTRPIQAYSTGPILPSSHFHVLCYTMIFAWNVHLPKILSVSIKIPYLPLQHSTPVTKPDRIWRVSLISPCFAQPHLASDTKGPVRLKEVVCHCHLLGQTSCLTLWSREILSLPQSKFSYLKNGKNNSILLIGLLQGLNGLLHIAGT